jgi:site-specific DNA-methyltransferase (adenine-specific)
MNIETLRILELTPDPNNARQHDDKNLKAIMGSLKQFGQRKPIVITEAGTIVAGNGTVEAAKRLGWTDIEVVKVPNDWTPDKVKAFAIADNRTAELANWNQQVLEKQLQELREVGFDVADFGFEVAEVPIIDIETFEDEAPEIPDEPTTRPGDIFQLGNHRLVCGDSTNPKVLAQALDSRLADCIFTDPPYNVDYQGGTKQAMKIKNDNMETEAFYRFLYDSFISMLENTRQGGAIYVCHSSRTGTTFRTSFVDSGWLFKQVLIWVKDSLVLSRQDYNWQHEPILYGWKEGAAHSWHGPFTNTTVLDFETKDLESKTKDELLDFVKLALNYSTVIREKRPRRNEGHPTIKPIGLIAKLLKNSMVKGELVLDPFGGSGSTLIAAEQLGLSSAIVELDPKYCDVIIERWEKLTGQKAELLPAKAD